MLLSIIRIITLMLCGWVFLFSPPTAEAVCPLCTVAVAGGLGLSRWFGISDAITGIWIGGLIISSSLWLSNFLGTKKINFPAKETINIAAFYAITFGPLYITKVIGHPFNTIFGVDKLIFGSIIGSGIFLSAVGIDEYIRKINGGKVKFFYQKVIIPVSLLLIFSLLFYLIKI